MEKTMTKVACKVTGFEIPVENEERAIKFYNNAFGWKIITGEKDHSHVETVGVDGNWVPKEKGAVNGMLYKKGSKNDRVAMLITVGSIADALEKVKSQNGRVVTEKTKVEAGWWAEITDTEGNLFELWENRE